MVQNALFGRSPFGIGLGAREGATPATTAVAAGVERNVTGSLSVTTKEGDTVTLSASLDATVTYAGARSRGVRLGAMNAQVSRSVSIAVEGDLSAKELREIRQVVKRFLHDLAGMVRGGQPSIADVVAVHAKTLASISASTDTTNTITVAALTARPLPVPAPLAPVTGDAPQDSPALRAPLSGEDAADVPGPVTPRLYASEPDATGQTLPVLLTRNG